MQLMEVDAAARSLPHKLWQERRLQERSARHPVGWIALGLGGSDVPPPPRSPSADDIDAAVTVRRTTSTPALCSEFNRN